MSDDLVEEDVTETVLVRTDGDVDPSLDEPDTGLMLKDDQTVKLCFWRFGVSLDDPDQHDTTLAALVDDYLFGYRSPITGGYGRLAVEALIRAFETELSKLRALPLEDDPAEPPAHADDR